MVERDLGFHLFLELCSSDAADTVMVDGVAQDRADHEGAGVGMIASADGAHAARGLIQPDTRNTAADRRESRRAYQQDIR